MAASFGSTSEEELISEINVTPLVDVVLVLLIIFMITAPVLYQSAIKVALPKAKTGEQSQKSPLAFSISSNGALSWGKDIVTWAELSKRLNSLDKNMQEETATISADDATPHGTVVRLMDILRQAGLTRFALNVEPK